MILRSGERKLAAIPSLARYGREAQGRGPTLGGGLRTVTRSCAFHPSAAGRAQPGVGAQTRHGSLVSPNGSRL
ncbi:MAG: hypothetical protein IRY88_13475 [Rubrobacteraceae bacterium]|nr:MULTISPECIES: hypothetical protein [Rubrobacter]MBX6764670.1 hypothetical protein [Rubrobacteraceae bacterium]